ncbi:MAG: hypothetical protein GX306_06060 [Clostridiales bacterium]|nr:hypothetical protein [Clostridiales bacterium]
MGKLILCCGARTNRPYVFPLTGTRIYSIEELCYYLYHHVYLIEESIFSDSLLDWIGTELKLSERSRKLKALKAQKADLKTLVTAVLCSCDYYKEEEIKGLIKKLDGIIGLPPIKRNVIKANEFLKNHQYKEAAYEYERILNSSQASELTPEDYGDILHNFAVAIAHNKGVKEASELFRQAYEHNHREESLKQYLYSIRLIGDGDFDDLAKEYLVDDILKEDIINEINRLRDEAKSSDSMMDIQRLKRCKAEGRITEYYKISDEVIERWKASVRQV